MTAFNSRANQFRAGLGNLTVSGVDVRREFEVLMKLRAELGPQGPSGAAPRGIGGGVTAAQAAAGAVAEFTNWKSLLPEGVQKWMRRTLQPQDLVYSTAERPDAGPGDHDGWMSTLTCNCLQEPGQLQGPTFYGAASSKKGAEREAAREAYEALFPESVHLCLPSPVAPVHAGSAILGQPSKKRKLAGYGDPAGFGAPAAAGPDPKTLLISGLQALLNRALTKADIEFSYDQGIHDGPDAMHVAIATLMGYDGGANPYRGEPQITKKLAEMSAAEAAYRALEHLMLPSIEQKKQEKLKAQGERLHALKAKARAHTLAMSMGMC